MNPIYRAALVYRRIFVSLIELLIKQSFDLAAVVCDSCQLNVIGIAITINIATTLVMKGREVEEIGHTDLKCSQIIKWFE